MADQKITEFDALGDAPADTDILPIVDDVSGTATTKKVTVAHLKEALNFKVTKTGQTTSYADCDDGYYEQGQALSYTDNSDGTVTDNNTGLMWKKCSEPDTGTGTCTGTHSKYTCAAALTRCEGLTFAGFSDWRLPNAKELWSITSLEPGSAPYINQTAFPGTVSLYYWSSTTYPSNTGYALSVYFNFGKLSTSNKTSSYYVRCVRG